MEKVKNLHDLAIEIAADIDELLQRNDVDGGLPKFDLAVESIEITIAKYLNTWITIEIEGYDRF